MCLLTSLLSVLGVLSSFIPLSIAVTLCLYWIVVVKVYLAKVRLASDRPDNDDDDYPIDTDNEDEEKVAVIRKKKNRRKHVEGVEKQDQEQTKALMQKGGKKCCLLIEMSEKLLIYCTVIY